MGEELDAKVIVETQELLGKFIKKPPLNEKLLRKPPFKFLHDVITSVINSTGFMKDVFTPDELNSENIKDRESKIMFLQKAVDYVASVTKEPLKIRPSKTVAGQEADKTNQFLQAMAKAIESSLQNGRTVDTQEIKSDKKSRSSSQSRKNEAAEKTEHKKSENGKEKSKSRSGADEQKNVNKSKTEDKKKSDKTKSTGDAKKSLENKRHGDRISSSKDAEKVKERAKDKDPKRTVDDKSSKEKLKSKGQHKDDENGARLTAKPNKESRNNKDSRSSSSRRQSITIKSSNDEKDPVVSPKKSPEKRIANGHITHERAMPAAEVKEVAEMTNGEQENRVSETVEQEMTTLQSKTEESGRATTAKLTRSDTMTLMDSAVETVVEKERVDVTAPPRPSTSTIRKASARPSTARPAAPRVRVVDTAPEEVQSQQISKPVSSIILDGEANKDDEENDIQMEEFSKDKEETAVSLQDLETKTHGSLVTQILETKKDLEKGSQIVGASFKQESKTVLSESARRKERDMMAREMEKLREGIQKVTRSANPLGKLIGYLQEDVDIMAREVDVWKLESGKLETELIKEERKSDAELERLQNQLQELEETIEAQVSEIFTCKSRILRNNDWIKQMISTSI